MRIAYVFVCILVASSLRAGSLEEIVEAYFAPEDVQVVLAIPTATDAERLNEMNRLASAVAALHAVASEFTEDSTERELIWKEIGRQQKLTERLLDEWNGIEAKRGGTGLLCRYYIRRPAGFETGFALVRDDKIVEQFFVQKVSGEVLRAAD